MSFGHLHLVLNHLPVIGIPLALLFLGYGTLGRNPGAQRFSLFVLLVVAAIAVPAFLTGEPAEELAEHLPGVGEAQIEPHEDAAKASLLLCLATGLAAAGTLWAGRKRHDMGALVAVTAVLALLATASLGYTANLGGQIRHTELREKMPAEK